MPYTLHNLGYETVPSDENGYSTRITIDDEGGDSECILLRADKLNATFPIDIDEWPLIVQAVEKLLADRAPKEKAFKPAVTKEFLATIDFSRAGTMEVLSGLPAMLDEAFTWAFTQQGQDYWYDRHHSKIELSDDDKALLQSWVDAADYYETNNG
jgi:hypothetical protein